MLFTLILTKKKKKKKHKFRVRIETADKNTTHKSSRKELKRKAQVRVIYRPGTRKPKNSQKNPPDKKIGFMYKRTEKAKKQRAEKKDKVIYLGTQLEHPRDRYRRKTKIKLKKEAEDKVACLGTRP